MSIASAIRVAAIPKEAPVQNIILRPTGFEDLDLVLLPKKLRARESLMISTGLAWDN